MLENQKNKRKILLVDDDQFLLNMYSLKFGNSGYEVEAASGGLQALERLRAGANYDAIIFDVVMPGMDGFEFAETVIKEKLAPNSSFIALTNQGQQSDIDRGKSLRVDGYIVKASTVPSEVVKEVTTIIKKKNSNF